MLYYDRTDINKGILLKVTAAKNVWFAIIIFFNHGFKFQDSVCNDCHVLTMLSVNSDITINVD